jgi:hypothetical protein
MKGDSCLKSIWNQAVIAKSKYSPGIFWREWGEPVRIAGIPAEIRTRHLQNTPIRSVIIKSMVVIVFGILP